MKVLITIGVSLILVAKVLLAWRININWDEFHFLSGVYALIRGDLTQGFQGAYTHLFTWLTRLPGNEVDQIIVARLVLIPLLLLTCILLWRLAALWTSKTNALIAPLCYLSMLPVLKHGASFRYDSILAPLSLFILLQFADGSSDRRRTVVAGVCFGVAIALTSKAVFLLPLLMAVWYLTRPESNVLHRLTAHTFTFIGVTAATSSLLLALHYAATPEAENVLNFAARASSKTLLDSPLLPQAQFLHASLESDWLAWTLISFGGIVSLVQRQYRVSIACSLSLLPILFYRNSFPYYYTVMLAPACVLAAVAVGSITTELRRMASSGMVTALTLTVAAALLAQCALHLYSLRHDDIAIQRRIVVAVHQTLPEPVPYIDHSGMIAAFPKVNFFMSSWGLEGYIARKRGFVRNALTGHKAVLLLANAAILRPDHPQFQLLLPEDRELIERFYLPYWGPIHVAGARAEIQAGVVAQLELPFPGKYRIETPVPIIVANERKANGDVVDSAGVILSVHVEQELQESVSVRFYSAAARERPVDDPPRGSIYTGL